MVVCVGTGFRVGNPSGARCFVVLGKPLVAVAFSSGGCSLSTILREAVSRGCGLACGTSNNGFDGAYCGVALAGRVLRSYLRNGDGGSYVECWVKISGAPRLVSILSDLLARNGKVKPQPLVRMRYGALARLVSRDGGCTHACFSLNPPPGVLPKMSIVVPGGRVEIFFVFDQRVLKSVEERGYRVLRVEELEFSDYILTPFQEYVLYRAYESGRYEYPRRVSLRKLAKEFGIAAPTLAEVLRRAEAKIMDTFMAHQMPHYYVMKLVGGGRKLHCRLVVETRRKKEA